MAYPTSVNSQVTDSVTQVSVKTLGDISTVATGNLFQATSQAMSHTANNMTSAYQNLNIIAQAVATACVKKMQQ